MVSEALHTAVKLSAYMTSKIERPRIDTQRQLVTITLVNKEPNNTCTASQWKGCFLV